MPTRRKLFLPVLAENHTRLSQTPNPQNTTVLPNLQTSRCLSRTSRTSTLNVSPEPKTLSAHLLHQRPEHSGATHHCRLLGQRDLSALCGFKILVKMCPGLFRRFSVPGCRRFALAQPRHCCVLLAFARIRNSSMSRQCRLTLQSL